jgi:hypothetical protein
MKIQLSARSSSIRSLVRTVVQPAQDIVIRSIFQHHDNDVLNWRRHKPTLSVKKFEIVECTLRAGSEFSAPCFAPDYQIIRIFPFRKEASHLSRRVRCSESSAEEELVGTVEQRANLI